MKIRRVERSGAEYPAVLRTRPDDTSPTYLQVLGDSAVFQRRLLGVICSIQCPGSVVIKTFDAIRELRDAGVAVVGGFHSPMERDCLDILLRGTQPVVLCAAKGLHGLRLGKAARQAIGEGRLSVLSPFDDRTRRTTATQAVQRNNLVAAMAEAVFVPHAAPGGKSWVSVRGALNRGQVVFTFDDDANSALVKAGARVITGEHVSDLIGVTNPIDGAQLKSR